MEAQEKTRLLAPTIAFPENHDMDRVAASIPEGASSDDTAAELVMRYALAAFFSRGVLMPIGYETGARRKVHVVETTPADRERDTSIDISARIAEINRLKAEIRTANLEGAEFKVSASDAPYLALLRLDAGHFVAAREAVLVLANPTESAVTVDTGAVLGRTGGMLGPFVDRTPGVAPLDFDPCCPATLRPREVRILVGQRIEVPAAAPGLAPNGEGRVIIESVSPELDGGRTPVKRVVGEAVAVSADIFSDGHDKIAAEILYRAEDEQEWRRTPMRFVDNDRWAGSFPIDRNTRYVFTIEGWRDPFASWLHEIHAKRKAGVDVTLESIEGVQIAEAAARNADGGPDGAAMWAILDRLAAANGDPTPRLAILLDEHNAELIARHADRVNLSRYDRELPVIADRLAAQFSAWYELFPRSMSHDPNRHGTFDDVIRHLPYVRDMGFDVLYFPPIHPIGLKNRKGKNNSLKAQPGDVGSVYAIGSEAGGHDAIHPDLGDIASFRRMVDAAHAHGLEIALDFCDPVLAGPPLDQAASGMVRVSS
jgi:starch synthase (maltosyl-transferring)